MHPFAMKQARQLGVLVTLLLVAAARLQEPAPTPKPLPAESSDASGDQDGIERYDKLVRDIAKCAAINDPIKRLDAFDSLAKQLGVAGPATTTQVNGKWRVSRSVSPIDDSLTVTLSLDAERDLEGWPRESYRPSLILRCKEKQLDVYFVTGMTPHVDGIDGRASVTLRYDSGKAFTTRLLKSTDGKALFFSDANYIVNRLSGHEKLLFQFTPFNSSPTMTEFDLRGLKDHVGSLLDACRKQD